SLAYRASRRLVEVEPLAPLTRQHAAKSVPVFRVLRERTTATRALASPPAATPLIGRQAELARLVDCAKAAFTAGNTAGRVVALVGEPGIGKSRLADELARAINTALGKVELIWVECHSYEQTVPYAYVARALRRGLKLSPGQDRADQAASVVAQVASL